MRRPGVLLPLLVESFLKRPFTLLYPREAWPLPPGYREVIVWSNEACTGCRICFTVCSAKAIEMIEDPEKKPLEKGRVRKQIPIFLPDRCMRCSQCEESCPFDAIHLKGGIGLVGYVREKMRVGGDPPGGQNQGIPPRHGVVSVPDHPAGLRPRISYPA